MKISVYFIALFFSCFSASTFAMPKSEAIKLCLKELKISENTAKVCKEENWKSRQCSDIKGKIKSCARPKILGY